MVLRWCFLIVLYTYDMKQDSFDHGNVGLPKKAAHTDIAHYNTQQAANEQAICELLAQEIDAVMPKLESKIWHGAPVWFDDGNPLVGYWVRKNHVQLLFWSGQSFDEPDLQPEGKFKAAEARYTSPDQINPDDIKRWCEKAQKIQWDYKNIVKRKGELIRLK